jgi:hypothetical protein
VLVCRKFATIELSEAELLIGVLATMSMALLCTVFGVLLEPKAKAAHAVSMPRRATDETWMNTDSAGQTPVWVRLAPGHCPVSAFSAWKNTVRDTSYACLSVSTCGCVELLGLRRRKGPGKVTRWACPAGVTTSNYSKWAPTLALPIRPWGGQTAFK